MTIKNYAKIFLIIFLILFLVGIIYINYDNLFNNYKEGFFRRRRRRRSKWHDGIPTNFTKPNTVTDLEHTGITQINSNYSERNGVCSVKTYNNFLKKDSYSLDKNKVLFRIGNANDNTCKSYCDQHDECKAYDQRDGYCTLYKNGHHYGDNNNDKKCYYKNNDIPLDNEKINELIDSNEYPNITKKTVIAADTETRNRLESMHPLMVNVYDEILNDELQTIPHPEDNTLWNTKEHYLPDSENIDVKKSRVKVNMESSGYFYYYKTPIDVGEENTTNIVDKKVEISMAAWKHKIHELIDDILNIGFSDKPSLYIIIPDMSFSIPDLTNEYSETMITEHNETQNGLRSWEEVKSYIHNKLTQVLSEEVIKRREVIAEKIESEEKTMYYDTYGSSGRPFTVEELNSLNSIIKNMDSSPETFEEEYIAKFKQILDSSVKDYALTKRTIENAQAAPAENIHS